MSKMVSWAAPTQRDDGSALPSNEIYGYEIRQVIGDNIYYYQSSTTNYLLPDIAGDYGVAEVAVIDTQFFKSDYVLIDLNRVIGIPIDLSSFVANTGSPKFDGAYPLGNRPVSNKFTITKSGGGFGSHPGNPYFDNFESRTVGQASTNSLGGDNELNISNPDFVSIANTGAFSGTKCVKMDYAAAGIASGGNNSSGFMFPKIYHSYATPTQKGYMSCRVKFSGAASSYVNIWKMGRFTSDPAEPYSGSNGIRFSYRSEVGNVRPEIYSGDSVGSVSPTQYKGSTPDTYNNITEQPLYNAATVLAANVWHVYEVEFDVGTLNTANAIAEERWDKILTVRHGNGTNSMTFKTTANPGNVANIMTPMCGIDDYSNIIMLMDEYFVDSSRCRVVMTDTPVYTTATPYWAIQPCPPADWADGTLNPTRNYSNFTLGMTVYYHVFNSLGVLVYSSPGVVLA